jgi:hypothetical protein
MWRITNVDNGQLEEVIQMTWLYSLAVVGLGSGLAYGVTRYRRWRDSQEEVMHCRCSRCEQKLRYKASRAGQNILCPCCHSRITLPTQPAPLSSSQRRVGQRLLTVRS